MSRKPPFSLWALPARLSLRRLLTLPYVALVLVLVLLIGTLSYTTARATVDTLSGRLLLEAVARILVQLDQHIDGSAEVLEAAFPSGTPAPASLAGDLEELRIRFWLATGAHREPNNYAYYGSLDGRFFGLLRHPDNEAELRLRLQPQGPRSIYRFTGLHGELGAPVLEDKVFEPTQRPWFQAAQASRQRQVWSPIYVDFKTLELVATLTRRIDDAQGRFAGVAATDLSLRQVNQFLSRLSLSPNAIAMVVEGDGNIVGVSRGPHLMPVASGEHGRVNAAEAADPLVRGAYLALRQQSGGKVGTQPQTGSFEAPDGERVQIGYARLTDSAGLDWTILVAVPRFDFLADVERNFWRTGLLAAVAALVALGIGFGVLSIVTRELRHLAEAARRVGEGVLDEPPDVRRQDELGDLARSFVEMQQRLLTDQLTGLSNRSAILRRIEDRIQQHRRRGDDRPFAVMFADFNRFKQINDRFGHDVGDAVLMEMGARLRSGVRAGDLVARFAGDEFVVLLESVNGRADAEAARGHLEAALSEPLLALSRLDPAHNHGASFGLAVYPEDGLDTQTLLRHADADMYARKRRRPDPAHASHPPTPPDA